MPIIAEMKKMLPVLMLIVLSAVSYAQSEDSLFIFDWNLENFFDYKGYKGDRVWTGKRFYAKSEGIAKTIFAASDGNGRFPDILAFQEVGDRAVLGKMTGSTLLRKTGLGIVHHDSPDPRGIDCGLLYRKESLNLISSKPCHVYDSSGAVMKTRDILLAEFKNGSGRRFAVLVCHLPSKLGQGSETRRKTAFARVNQLCDSIFVSDSCPVIAVGDFNQPMSWMDSSETKGSIKFNGVWERIDGAVAGRGVRVEERVFDAPFLLERDSAHGGLKPRRTFSGPRYLGGLSDHLPVIVRVWY